MSVDSKITDILCDNKNVDHYSYVNGRWEIRLVDHGKVSRVVTSVVRVDEYYKTTWIEDYGTKCFQDVETLYNFISEFIDKYLTYRDKIAGVFEYLLSDINYSKARFRHDIVGDTIVLKFSGKRVGTISYNDRTNKVAINSVAIGDLGDPEIHNNVKRYLIDEQK